MKNRAECLTFTQCFEQFSKIYKLQDYLHNQENYESDIMYLSNDDCSEINNKSSTNNVENNRSLLPIFRLVLNLII